MVESIVNVKASRVISQTGGVGRAETESFHLERTRTLAKPTFQSCILKLIAHATFYIQ